jgi:hypothetical protein
MTTAIVGNGSIFLTENDGSITADSGTWQIGFNYWGTPITNKGLLKAVNGGTIQLGRGSDDVGNGSFENDGTLEADDGSTISIPASMSFTNLGKIILKNGTFSAGSLNIGDGTFAGSGRIECDLICSSDPSTLSFNLGGETQGILYDSLEVGGNATLAGYLQVRLVDGFLPSQSDTFIVLSVDSNDILSGQFLNVEDGGRLETVDGAGSFLVSYGSGDAGHEIVLSDFQPGTLPEPAGCSLLGISAAALARRRRKHSLQTSRAVE